MPHLPGVVDTSKCKWHAKALSTRRTPYLSGVVDTSRAPIGGILGGPLLKIKSSEYSAVARTVCGGYPPNISASSM